MKTKEHRPIWYDGVPNAFWCESKNRRAFMQWLERKLDIRQPEDWYDLTLATVKRYGGLSLLKYHYGSSLVELVREYVPWYDWKEWLFVKVSKGFWDDAHNRLRYLEWLGKELGFEEMEDWYRLRGLDLEKNYGSTLNQRYRSTARIVMEHFPEYEWLPWRFTPTPRGFWDDPKNLRRYLEWVGEKLGFRELEDWHRIRNRDLREHYGGTLLLKKRCAASSLAMSAFPEYEWHPWRFGRVAPRDFWKDPKNIRRYLEWLGEQLGFDEPEDWYRLEVADLSAHHGNTLLLKYHHSPPAVVMAGFPDYDWKEWFFNVSPRGFWDDPKNVRRFLNWLGEELGFQSMEDWYQLTIEDVAFYRGHTLLNRFKHSLVKIVPHYFPEHDWEMWKFRRPSEAFWGDPDHCRRYLDWLGKKLGFEKPEDWYQLRSTDFTRNHGGGLLNQFNRSLSAVLKAHIPEVDWKEWLFYIPPRRIWSDRETRRRYLEWLAEILGIRDADDWGRLRCRHIVSNRGNALVRRYKYSVHNILLDTFPADHPAVRGILAVQNGRDSRKSRSRARSR